MGAANLGLWQFLSVYLLLFLVLLLLQKLKIGQSRKLLIASVRMTIQLMIAGTVLQLIFEHPHPLFTVAYLAAITLFAIRRALAAHKGLSFKFQLAVALSLAGAGLAVLAFFVCVVAGQNFLNPQYTITLSGMIIGNAMTGISLGLKTFTDDLTNKRSQLMSLLHLGVHPKRILRPLVNNALESALLPTLNSMLGMGIIFLPGMMTGQILSGTLPTTAILYQIAIMASICTSVCLSVFCSLYFGYRTLYNEQLQILFPEKPADKTKRR